MAYASLLFIAIVNRENEIRLETVVSVSLWVFFGVGVTHAQRFFFIRLGWLDMRLPNLIPRVLVTSTISAIVIYAC